MPYETHYQLLLVDPCADLDIISRVYRLLAKRHHPDRDSASGAATRMSQLSDAFAVLSDPKRRAAYDRSIGVSCPADRGSRIATEMRAFPIDTTAEEDTSRATDPSLTEAPSPYGEAGPPPAFPPARGAAMSFGRYRGWTLAQIDVHDRNYLQWLRRTPHGRSYASDLDQILGQTVLA